MQKSSNKKLSKWINLHDDQATLKAGYYKGHTVLILTGLNPRRDEFAKAIKHLGFNASSRGAFLLREAKKGESISPRIFRSIWPNAKTESMPIEDFYYNLDAFEKNVLEKKEQELSEGTNEQTQEEIDQQAIIQELTDASVELGINYRGNRVFKNDAARVLLNEKGQIVHEAQITNEPALFLKAITPSSYELCVDGLLLNMRSGLVLRKEDTEKFINITTDKKIENINQADLHQLRTSISKSIARTVLKNDMSASQASLISLFFEQQIPYLRTLNENATQYSKKNESSLPIALPLCAQVSRLVSSEALSINVKGNAAIEVYGFIKDTNIQIEEEPVYEQAKSVIGAINKEQLNYGLDAQADVYIFAPGSQTKQVLTERNAKTIYYDTIENIQLAFNQAKELDLPILSAGAIRPSVAQMQDNDVCAYIVIEKQGVTPKENVEFLLADSWSELKTGIDEIVNQSQLKEHEASQSGQSIIEDTRLQNRYQRPYSAQTKIGSARTMVPISMHTPLAYAFDALKANYGDIDDFVANGLGIDKNTLGQRLSAEQIDASALAFSKIREKKGFILADETGIGKGRVIAASISYALRQNKKVIFLSDRANLFSDIARDLIDIKVWDDVIPFILNSNVDVLGTEVDGKASVLARSLPNREINKIISNQAPLAASTNMIMATYTQLNRSDSKKPQWLKNLCDENTLLILDESHIANGDSSNINATIDEMAQRANAVVFSSATWASNAKNLKIYKRAMPESVNLNSVIDNMNKQGDIFSETFSGMLVADGAMIRREHDLSKLEIIMELPSDERIAYNIQEKDKIAGALSAIAMLSGEINQSLQALNRESRHVLIQGRAALNDIRVQSPQTEIQEDNIQAQALEQNENRQPLKAKIFKNSFSEGDALYQVMRRTQAALLLDQICEEVIKTLNKNKKPIVIFDETGESFVRKAIKLAEKQLIEDVQKLNAENVKSDSQYDRDINRIKELLDEGVAAKDLVHAVRAPTIRDMLFQTLEDVGNIQVQDITTDHEGNEKILSVNEMGSLGDSVSVRKMKASGLIQNEELSGKFQKAINEITQMINDIAPLPIALPDALAYKLKQAKEDIQISEISGRTIELDYIKGDDNDSITNLPQYATLGRRKQTKVGVVQAVNDFNNGRSDLIAINSSGATGISVHASPRFLDKSQRVMLEWQPSLDVRKRIQIFGRGNRYDQVSTPQIKTMLTGVSSEARSIMMNNKKITALSANIRSSRDNAILNEDIPDLLTADGDKVALEYLKENPGVSARLGVPHNLLERPYGLMNFVMQRGEMLTDNNYKQMFSELCNMYRDLQIENEINDKQNSGFKLKDWQAKTISQKRLWGPNQEQSKKLSAFDQPVFIRQVEHEVHYKPISYEELLDEIQENVKHLLEDDRISVLPIKPIVPTRTLLFDEQKEKELDFTDEAKKGFRVKELLLQLANKTTNFDESELLRMRVEQFLNQNNGENAQDTQEQTEMDLDTQIDIGSVAETRSSISNKKRTGAFEELAGKSLAVNLRLPGQNNAQQSFALVSKSGKSAKLWWINKNSEVYSSHINLNQALKLFNQNADNNGYYESLSKALTPMDTGGQIDGDSWVIKRFKNLYGSILDNAPLIDLDNVAQSAVKIIQAKKKIAQVTLGFENEQEALSPNISDNAVKEAARRETFMHDVIKEMRPGANLLITNQKTKSFFNTSEFYVSAIEIPPKGQEGTFSKWHFDLVAPGNEKPFRMSASTLFKQGKVIVSSNILDKSIPERSRETIKNKLNSFRENRYKKHSRLLIGNLYQSLQWSRAARIGQPITYTDDVGNSIRAIDISHTNELQSFPERVFSKEAINNFIETLWDPESSLTKGIISESLAHKLVNNRDTFIVSTSMDAAIRNHENRDSIIISPRANRMSIAVLKKDRTKIRNRYKAIISTLKSKWENDNPNSEETNPFESINIVSKRTSARELFSNIYLSWPIMLSTQENTKLAKTIFNEVVSEAGMELFCTHPAITQLDALNRGTTVALAKAVNHHYYENLARQSEQQAIAIQNENKAVSTYSEQPKKHDNNEGKYFVQKTLFDNEPTTPGTSQDRLEAQSNGEINQEAHRQPLRA